MKRDFFVIGFLSLIILSAVFYNFGVISPDIKIHKSPAVDNKNDLEKVLGDILGSPDEETSSEPLLAPTGDCSVQPGSQNYYVDKLSLCGTCSDSYTKGQNSVTQPWCNLGVAASQVVPGDTVFIQDGRYGNLFHFTIDGTQSQPITWRGLGDEVYLGYFEDIDDSSFSTTGFSNVYLTTFSGDNGGLRQTYYDPIIINDSDSSPFTLLDEDGPMIMNSVSDFTTLEDIEGTYLVQGTDLYVHPYDDRVPSDSNTDFVMASFGSNGYAKVITADWNVFDNYHFRYSGGNVFRDEGSNNVYKNFRAGGQWFTGIGTRIENATFSHIIARDTADLYDVQVSSSGSSTIWSCPSCFTSGGKPAIAGDGQVMKNVEIYGGGDLLAGEPTNFYVDGLLLHGSYNHCWLPSNQVNLKVKNLVSYGCQDGPGFLSGMQNTTFEHMTIQSSVVVEETGGVPVRDLTFKNSILTACSINMANNYGVSCEWEGSTKFENVIFFCNPGQELQIEHCLGVNSPGGTGNGGPTDNYITEVYNGIDDYLANCATSGPGYCMEFDNVQLVQSNDYSNVLVGGNWDGIHPWDYHITDENSPAHDAAPTSSATTDFERDVRPQGLAYDIGADEFDEGIINAVCGNDIIEAGEQCDNSNLGGNSCTTIGGGFNGGTLNCYPPGHAQECMFDTSQCTSPVCSLTNAYWSTNNANEGEFVNLFVNGTDCNGQQINIEIWEDDTVADELIEDLGSFTISGNQASTSWQAYYTNDPENQAEYYFIAEVVSNPGETAQSLNLIVPEDTTAPIITNINSVVNQASVTINWTTNELATTYIEYGTSQGAYTDNFYDGSLINNHEISLTNLQVGTTYYYRIHADDFANNTAISQEENFTTSQFSGPFYATFKYENGLLTSDTNYSIDAGWESGNNQGSVDVLGIQDLNWRQAVYAYPNIIGNNQGQIPLGATITSANLSIYVSGQFGGLPPSINYYKITDPSSNGIWEELVTTPDIRNTGNNWDTQGGDVETFSTVNVPLTGTGLYHKGDVTSHVQDWSDGDPNQGWLIRTIETGTGQAFITSKEFGAGSNPALLEVEYTLGQVSNPVCGDDVVEGSEQCDNSNLNGQTCQTQGYDSGTLNCYPPGHAQECMFNVTQCVNNPGSGARVFEGFGAHTEGGSNGATYIVTSLGDSGAGTLRDALSQSNRHIIFAVAGDIELESVIRMSNVDHITINGSNAPAPGITVTASPTFGTENPLLELGSSGSYGTVHDIIITDIRFRDPADTDPDPLETRGDNLRIDDGTYNVVIDHVSTRRCEDGNIDINTGANNITVQWSVLAECSKNQLIKFGGVGRITLHHNLYAGGGDRSPAINGEGDPVIFDMVNNIIYNWDSSRGTDLANFTSGNIVKNYYLNSSISDLSDAIEWNTPLGSLYTENNIIPPFSSDPGNTGTRISAPTITTETDAITAFWDVVDEVGARPRDAEDQAYIDAMLADFPGGLQSCSAQGGNTCSQGQTCSGNTVPANDSSFCCVGTCQDPPSCSLTDAYWSTTEVSDGTNVNLIVEGSDCSGEQINYEIWECDQNCGEFGLGGGDDNLTSGVPGVTTFTGSSTSVQWTSAWESDCSGLCNPPEFYFRAFVNSEIISSGFVNTLVVNSNDLPSVSLDNPNNGHIVDEGTNINFQCSASDNDNIQNLELLYYPNGGNEQVLDISSSDTLSYNTNALQDGNHLWNCRATDNLGNSNVNPVNRSLTINQVVAPDLENPNVTSLSLNSSNIEEGESVTVSVTVNDNIQVDTVSLEVTYPDLSTNTFTMSGSEPNYNYIFTDTTQIGDYDLRIIANDTNNNINNTETTVLRVSETNTTFNIVYQLQGGTNFISIPVNLVNADVETVFADILGNLESVYTYENSNWLVYHRDRQELNTLNTVNVKNAYILEMSNADSFTLQGEATTDPRTLNVGWNLVGVSSDQNEAITSYISASDLNSVIGIWEWDSGSNDYVEIQNYASSFFEPGKLYWVETDASIQFNPPIISRLTGLVIYG